MGVLKKIGIIFGGMSTEHDVSVNSGISVINNINKQKYKIYPIYIEKDGTWFVYLENEKKVGKKINDATQYLKNLDVVFPVLHGIYGEDGSIQGMLQMLKIPYVGCGILASSLGMDKVYSKIIFDRARFKAGKILLYKKKKK